MRQISIWFFTGVLLAIYGILILGAGIYEYASQAGPATTLAGYHPGIWWGGLMLVVGLTYSWLFLPGRRS